MCLRGSDIHIIRQKGGLLCIRPVNYSSLQLKSIIYAVLACCRDVWLMRDWFSLGQIISCTCGKIRYIFSPLYNRWLILIFGVLYLGILVRNQTFQVICVDKIAKSGCFIVYFLHLLHFGSQVVFSVLILTLQIRLLLPKLVSWRRRLWTAQCRNLFFFDHLCCRFRSLWCRVLAVVLSNYRWLTLSLLVDAGLIPNTIARDYSYPVYRLFFTFMRWLDRGFKSISILIFVSLCLQLNSLAATDLDHGAVFTSVALTCGIHALTDKHHGVKLLVWRHHYQVLRAVGWLTRSSRLKWNWQLWNGPFLLLLIGRWVFPFLSYHAIIIQLIVDRGPHVGLLAYSVGFHSRLSKWIRRGWSSIGTSDMLLLTMQLGSFLNVHVLPESIRYFVIEQILCCNFYTDWSTILERMRYRWVWYLL